MQLARNKSYNSSMSVHKQPKPVNSIKALGLIKVSNSGRSSRHTNEATIVWDIDRGTLDATFSTWSSQRIMQGRLVRVVAPMEPVEIKGRPPLRKAWRTWTAPQVDYKLIITRQVGRIWGRCHWARDLPWPVVSHNRVVTRPLIWVSCMARTIFKRWNSPLE